MDYLVGLAVPPSWGSSTNLEGIAQALKARGQRESPAVGFMPMPSLRASSLAKRGAKI